MGKKKGTPSSMSKCRSCLEFGDFDDNASAVSSQGTGCLSACGGDGPSTDDLTLDQFSQHLDDLFEKRGSTREKALEMLIAMLREDVRVEDCEKNESTLIGRCTNSLKRGGAAEAANAATLLALHIVTLPQPSDRLLLEFQDDVVKAAQSGKSVGGRVAALDALALATFVASEDDAHTLEVMAHARALWRAGDAKVRAAALRAWSLLYVSLQNSLPQAAVYRTLQELTALLNETDVDVRGATGEAVALLYHLAGLGDSDTLLDGGGGAEAEDSDSGAGDDSDSAPLQRSPATSASAGSASAGLDDVVDRMRDLASNKGDAMRRSRRDKASLRSTFRGLLALLSDSTSSSTKVKLQHGDVLYVDSMEKVVALNFFRRVLGSGFQVHLQHNPLLHDVFDYKPAVKRGERLSALEKRYTRSPSSAASKDRTASRKSDRASKSASRTHLPDLAEY